MTGLRADERGEGVGALGIIMLIVLVIVIAVGGILAYKYFHKSSSGIITDNVPTRTVNTSSDSSTNTSNTSATNESNTSATATPTESATGTSVVKVTELGVQLTVPNSIDDLVYLTGATKTTPAATTALLSTAALSKLDPACGVDSTKTSATLQGIGELYEYTGKYTSSTNPDKTSVWSKQFPSFYVAYNTPPSTCSKTASIGAKAQTQITDLKAALSTMVVTPKS
jgi:hypothetical protein